jgi:hypothetical protein
LHNRYKSAERKISQKNPEYTPCHVAAVKIWSHFDLYYGSNGQLKFHPPFFSIFSLAAILVGSRDQRTQIWKRAIQIPFHQSLAAIGLLVSEEKIKVYDVRQTTDSKWWQKLTWPLVRWAEKAKINLHQNFPIYDIQMYM